MEDYDELVPSPLLEDFWKFNIVHYSAIYRPIKLRQIHSDIQYDKLKIDDYAHLPYAFKLKNKKAVIDFFAMAPSVQTRFVELLASLTLHHFSKAGKNIYYDCVDIRGLEFSALNYDNFFNNSLYIGGIERKCELHGIAGRKMGCPREKRFRYYAVFDCRITISLSSFLANRNNYLLLQRFKIVNISAINGLFNDHITDLCSAVFHPNVKHVKLDARYLDKAKPTSLKKLAEFFEFCKNVKNLYIKIGCHINCKFSELKKMIENWSTNAVNLESFIFASGWNAFQLYKNELKRCVKLGDKWFWSSKCNLDEFVYPRYYPIRWLYLTPFASRYYRESYFYDFVGIPKYSNYSGCVQEVMEIPMGKTGLSGRKRRKIIHSITKKFDVKVLFVKNNKVLTISGTPAKVARAKKYIQSVKNGVVK